MPKPGKMGKLLLFMKTLRLLTLLVLLSSELAFAAPTLGYNIRRHTYSGFGTNIRGDIRTVGMAGATVGLADTFIAAMDNPAGLAMTLPGADLNFTSNYVHDNRIQDYNETISTTNFGLAMSAYPWAFSLGYVSPYQEGQPYEVPGAPTNPLLLSVKMRQFLVSAARVFLDNRLSLGLTLSLYDSRVEYEATQPPELRETNHAYAFGATLGALYRLPRRVIFGLSYTLPLRLSGDMTQQLPGLQDFYRGVDIPGRLGFGIGWIPNRFFRMDMSLLFVGITPDAALLIDDTSRVGKNITFQPRIGGSYQFVDYKELQGTVFLGSYFETVRIEGAADRVHFTSGVEVKPWIFTVGTGIDASAGYKNYLVTLSVDLVKIMEKLDLIPTGWKPASGGFLPSPIRSSDEGLPRPLVKNWVQRGPNMNPIELGLAIPKRVEEKVKQMIAPTPSPAPKKRLSKKARQKKKKKSNSKK